MALKRLVIRLIGPPLFAIPVIMQVTAQHPIIPAVMPTAVVPILEISVLASMAAVVFVRLVSMPDVFFMISSKIVCF
jgi:hypothetical protein